MVKTLEEERGVAAGKAWVALSRYKFVMFGYWAGVWVHLNHLCNKGAANPFARLVQIAKGLCGEGEEG